MGRKRVAESAPQTTAAPIDVSEGFLSVTDLKHYFYCPRIIYFEKVLHVAPQLGSQQEESKKEHVAESSRDQRRKEAVFYGLPSTGVEKQLHIPLVSSKLCLQGVLDLLLVVTGEYIPVEYKNMASDRGRPWPDHKYQLTAYALLVEENYTTLVKRGYISYLPEDLTLKIDITPYMKTHTVNSITEAIEIVRRGKLPPVNVPRMKCTGGCGYLWICKRT